MISPDRPISGNSFRSRRPAPHQPPFSAAPGAPAFVRRCRIPRKALPLAAVALLSWTLPAASEWRVELSPQGGEKIASGTLVLREGEKATPFQIEDASYTYAGRDTWFARFGWRDPEQTGVSAEPGPGGGAIRFTTGFGVAQSGTLPVGGEEWTLSLWVRPDERDYSARVHNADPSGFYPMPQTLLAFSGDEQSPPIFSLRLLRSRPLVTVGAWRGWTDRRLPLGRWSHVAITRKGGALRVDIDGIPSRWILPLEAEIESGLDQPAPEAEPAPAPEIRGTPARLFLGGLVASPRPGQPALAKVAEKFIGAISGLRIAPGADSPESIRERVAAARAEADRLAKVPSPLADPTVGAVGRRPDKSGESPERYRGRLAWWREAKFGMFIHWGVSSLREADISWSRGNAHRGIPKEEYDALYKEFDPQGFDPAEWAKQMKAAGFRYGVLTSKHHDGFCLWPTEVTGYNILSAPYGKDIVGPYLDGLRAAGLRAGLYFSWPDWSFEEAHTAGIADRAEAGKMRSAWNVRMLKELATRYGPVDLFWFDSGGEFAEIEPLQPDAVVNDRAYRPKMPGGTDMVPHNNGDFFTPENSFADFPYINPDGTDTPWEMCSAMPSSWGFTMDDPGTTPEQIVRDFSRICGMGGNWLLNVAPRADGRLPADAMAILGKVGEYLAVHGEAFYGTHRTRLGQQAFGFATAKSDALYLHVHRWPESGQLVVEDVAERPARITLLGASEPLEFSHAEGVLTVRLPGARPESPLPILRAEYPAAK